RDISQRSIASCKMVLASTNHIRNTFETIMVKQANRVVLLENLTKEELSLITEEDVEGVI
ncbi:MAG: hypothetical protein SO160_07080, partial [Lachnospiraceae bacterium]|nr:hypothetical protein [Lachnospiraceae bacterium]